MAWDVGEPVARRIREAARLEDLVVRKGYNMKVRACVPSYQGYEDQREIGREKSSENKETRCDGLYALFRNYR